MGDKISTHICYNDAHIIACNKLEHLSSLDNILIFNGNLVVNRKSILIEENIIKLNSYMEKSVNFASCQCEREYIGYLNFLKGTRKINNIYELSIDMFNNVFLYNSKYHIKYPNLINEEKNISFF